ncbi:MAG: extracellular solute-binding protein [Candidatus Enteromonas sp.]|nr:extracellular solute-binding protein [Candidatus Enteromonas sp.]
MNSKKCLLLASLSVLSLSSCALLPTFVGSSEDEASISHPSSSEEESSEKDNSSSLSSSSMESTPDLTYWCPQRDAEVTRDLAAEFKASKEEYKDLKIEPLGYFEEGEVYGELQGNPKAAADVMAMHDDNILSAATAKEIVEFSEEERNAFMHSEGPLAVEACSLNETMYGLPYRADEGPMPFYDSNVYDAPVKLASLEAVLETAKKAGKKVYFDLCNGWYNATLLTVGGGSFTRQKNGRGGYEMYTDIADPDKIDGAAAALNSFKTLYNTYKETWVINSDNVEIRTGFESGEIAYAILYNDLDAIQQRNPNVKVALWPTINVNGEDAQMQCFLGYKAFVCKRNSDLERLALAKEFTKFLANKFSQVIRAKELGYGPTNREAQATEEAKSLEFSARIAEMTAMGATIGQAISTAIGYWDPMRNLGLEITSGNEGWGEYGSAQRLIQEFVSYQGWTSVKAK